ncbi:cell division protein FtsK [Fructobacillus tropaeoli]|uniref:FtsK/SpoIIIE family DNA translocase n=1 Tax=Fructobacillus tropaeoli TaxID=709323 RepID=UPI001456277F|nr:DNA translocase FtsK [Fructobacillus tropaeoli]NLS37636.1 cell division protein FtsK [Fructobacillus tropaeoli]
MAKQTKRRSQKKKKVSRAGTAGQIVGLLAIILLSIFAIFQLGLFGIYLADMVRFFFGNLYQITLLPLIAWATVYLVMDKSYPIPGRIYVGVGMIYLATVLLSSMLFFTQNELPGGGYASQVIRLIGQDMTNQSAGTPVGAGMLGALLYQLTFTLLSNVGVAIIVVVLYIAGVIVTFRLPARDLAQKGVVKAHENFTEFQKQQSQKRDQRQLLAEKKQQDLTEFGDHPFGLSKTEPKADEPAADPFFPDPAKDIAGDGADLPAEEGLNLGADPVEPTINWQAPTTPSPAPTPAAPVQPTSSQGSEDVHLNASAVDDDDYQLPQTSLLTKTQPTDQTKEAQSLNAKSRLVHDTLQSFGVDATVSSVSLGPTVTQYELKPGQGVKVNRIANLADDLALALAAKSIRIEAPIPGKPYVGIEVPNDTQAVVGFRSMIEQSNTIDQGLLTVPLGRDVTGNIVSVDLSAMPHLLIAGSTGSGKSVGLNGIIVSLLLKAKPSEVKLMMVDPKVVELSIYNGIPHLLTPVVSDPRKAAKSLQKLVDEMENRYDLLAQFGKRNIGEYNAAVDDNNAHAKETGNAIMTKLPYIVAVVDEFADLMATVGSEIEVSIARLGAKARAAGIHMILATQRPDVKVINGTIKSNIPGRIAFRTASGIDSRTILDTNGAEKLLGRGDMIFAPPGKAHKRLQGAFISNQDVTAIVDFVKGEQDAVYDEKMTVTDEEVAQDENGGGGNSDDELFEEALEFVIDQQKASTSLLQRRFRIGYNRAARLVDDLENAGYIGPADGARPRHVNVSKKTDE